MTEHPTDHVHNATVRALGGEQEPDHKGDETIPSVADQHPRARRKPRALDYVMWTLVGLTMVAVAKAAFSIESLIVRLLAVAYIAAGGFLLWRRLRAVR